MARRQRVKSLERKAGTIERPTVYLDLSGLSTGKLSLMDKVKMLRQAREQAGPGGRVEVITFAGDPILEQLHSIEREPETVLHWSDNV